MDPTDVMDDFTKRMLNRAKERQMKLQNLGHAPTKPDVTRVSSNMPGSPQSQPKTLNIQRDNLSMEIKLTSPDDVRVEVEIQNESDQTKHALSSGVKSRLARLGKMYANDESTSPVQRTEQEPAVVQTPEQKAEEIRGRRRRLAEIAKTVNEWEDDLKHVDLKGSEDASKKYKAPKAPVQNVTIATGVAKQEVASKVKYQAPPAPKMGLKVASPRKVENERNIPAENKKSQSRVSVTPIASVGSLVAKLSQKIDTNDAKPSPKTPVKKVLDKIIESPRSATKTESPKRNLQWDDKLVTSLESQGFSRSSTKLVYDYSQPKTINYDSGSDYKTCDSSNNSPNKTTKTSIQKPASKTNLNKENVTQKFNSPAKPLNKYNSPTKIVSQSIASKTAMFEPKSPAKKDPAFLSLAERKALFERNKTGAAPVPISSFGFGIAPSAKMLQERAKVNEMEAKLAPVAHDYDESESDDERDTRQVQRETTPVSDEGSIGVLSPRSISSKRMSDQSIDSPKVTEVISQVKRAKISRTVKEGRLYPCLSDIEASTPADTETEGPGDNTSNDNSTTASDYESSANNSGDPDTSFGREILRAVEKNEISNNKKRHADDSTTTSEISDVLNEMDEYLDEQSSDDEGPTPAKTPKSDVKPSFSFHFKKCTDQKDDVIAYSRVSLTRDDSAAAKSTGNDYVMDGDTVLPLVHTVSFYRKQQAEFKKPVVRQVVRSKVCPGELEVISSGEELNRDEQEMVMKKIKALNDEVSKQQTVISQASQALNLCCSTFEFSGSKEQVEAERLLLLATQRRTGAMHELQRLNVERTLNEMKSNIQSGSLTISGIVLPLKRDYIRALTSAGGLGHHILCVARCSDQVLATKTVSTGNPRGPPSFCLNIADVLKFRVYSDFAVTLEIYSMQAHEEVLPHEVKYHINAGKKNKLMTPKKSKQESKLTKTAIESPGGPNTVRTSSFTMIGYVIFSLKEINRKQWTLNKVPYAAPLDGTIQMNVACEFEVTAEKRGFLTMFEDVSGFGAWHRRWCLLKGTTISYWKYPDDERRKTPINSISIEGCVTDQVAQVSRDICARPNTFLLEFNRRRQDDDVTSLIMVLNDDATTTIRHLFSADTKEERIEWCNELNKVLNAMRLWSNKKN